jgi:putative component of membrane protein insertase Oxa1/YidC/SpoIIIJ protein YidD
MSRALVLLIVVMGLCTASRGQNTSASASEFAEVASSQLFSMYEYKAPAKRKLLSLNTMSTWQKINPLVYVGAGLLFFYQRGLSEQIQASCTFHTSCSSYTKYAIQERGFLTGIILGADQLTRCANGGKEDYPAYKLTDRGKIIDAEFH